MLIDVFNLVSNYYSVELLVLNLCIQGSSHYLDYYAVFISCI